MCAHSTDIINLQEKKKPKQFILFMLVRGGQEVWKTPTDINICFNDAFPYQLMKT